MAKLTNDKQFTQTRLNKIKRIERELQQHPKIANNKKLMDRLAELKGGKN